MYRTYLGTAKPRKTSLYYERFQAFRISLIVEEADWPACGKEEV